jgi:transposase
MLRPNASDLKVYLHRAPIDMRRGRNGLAALVQQVMKQDPFGPSFFLFTDKRFKALKVLVWDRNGNGVYHKLIESQEKFHWPRLFEEEVVELTSEQLSWLMDGYDVWAKPHQPVRFTHVS